MPSLNRIACAVAMFGCLSSAFAADSAAGLIKNAKGTATVERSSGKLPVRAGMEVLASDRIVTAGDGSVGIMLRDETMLSVGPNSSVSLDKFAFDPATHDGVLNASVKRGTMAVISGKLSKKSPDAVKFSTPSAILGVRGTEFVIDAGQGSEEAK
ncbi:hypothetical protein E4L96_04685 [Massilia arenosa]|uniref:FecR protein domain-containing protein n=2 Tax=Zemynaea arenosa TaxID=2561931 RepID=A0A4Y9SJB5_9BURK|nr:hypothetical protein E4L96_04685 [Massilia arenosa]